MCCVFPAVLRTRFPGVRANLRVCAFLLTLNGADAVRSELPGIPAAHAAP